MDINFQGQVVLVTGATRGIGKQIADDLAALGANLILTGTDKAIIDALNEDARRKNSTKTYIDVDFRSSESLSSFLHEISRMDRIDVCINNAGINKINYIDETALDDWIDIRNVNLDAPFLITRQVSRLMKRNRYGRIVNISSIFGVIGKAKRSIYTVSKYGLRGLTVSTSIDLAPYNILVNTISPGFVNTELTKRILSQEEMEELASQVPMGRIAEPEEISNVAIFLASSLNTYITGQNIIVDGGFVNV